MYEKNKSKNHSHKCFFFLFQDGGGRRTFAGVSEFVAPEGVVVIPMWIMKNAGEFEKNIDFCCPFLQTKHLFEKRIGDWHACFNSSCSFTSWTSSNNSWFKQTFFVFCLRIVLLDSFEAARFFVFRKRQWCKSYAWMAGILIVILVLKKTMVMMNTVYWTR